MKQCPRDMPEPPYWFVFGVSPCGRYVDINDGDRDVMQHVPRRKAARIIARNNRVWWRWKCAPCTCSES